MLFEDYTEITARDIIVQPHDEITYEKMSTNRKQMVVHIFLLVLPP